MMMQELHELLHLVTNRQPPVIVPPDVLGQVERQPLAPDAAVGGQPALQGAPEPLQAVRGGYHSDCGWSGCPNRPSRPG